MLSRRAGLSAIAGLSCFLSVPLLSSDQSLRPKLARLDLPAHAIN